MWVRRHRRPMAARSTRPRSTAWRRWASRTTVSTPPRCARRRGLRCSRGRNHTFVGNGQIAALANDFDGFSGIIPKSSATVAEVLKDYGYNTGAWGKWHNTPEEQITCKGPVRLLADGLRLRVFLRIPRRRGVAVRADPDAQHHAGRPPQKHEGLSSHRGHRGGRDPVAARAEGLSRPTSRSSCTGRRVLARPAPGHEGMGRQVQGQVRRRLGQVSRAHLRARQGQGLDSRKTRSSRRGPRRWHRGTRSPRPRSPFSAG